MKTPESSPAAQGRSWSRVAAGALTVVLTLQLGVIGGLFLARRAAPGQRLVLSGGRAGATRIAPPSARGPAAAPGQQAAPAQAGGGRALLLDVLDSNGQPQRGVTVSAQPVDERGRPVLTGRTLEPVGELGVLRGGLPTPKEVIAGVARYSEVAGLHAVTDGDGQAHLKDVPVGRVLVSCSHLGQSAAAEVVVPERRAEGGLRVVLRLQAAPASLVAPNDETPDEVAAPAGGPLRDVQGEVLDERGMSLPRARVEAQAGRLRRSTTTDGGGRFSLLGLPPGPLQLLVQHQGFAPLTASVGEEGAALRLQLQPGAGIEGVVRERRLSGVPDRLRLTLVSGGVRLPIPVGRDGRFTLSGLPVGEGTLLAEAPGHVPLSRKLQLPGGDRPDTVTLRDVVVEMEVGGTLSGSLRDGGGGAAGVAVRVLDERGAEIGHATSDGRGEFRVALLPAGHVRVQARSPAGQASELVEILAGEERRVDLELR